MTHRRRCDRNSPASFAICLASIIVLILMAAPAQGQLTSEDIEALREQGRAEGWTFTVDENGATQYSLDQLCGLKVPDNWQDDAVFDPMTPDKSLPEAYDWRDQLTLPPVRNQGGCGSCWAFATVGPLECNIKIKDNIIVDLSEQYLVSCNNDDWDCSGGWWAHKYHQWKNDPCYETGAVMEADFPYAAANLPCNCPYPHQYRIHNWAYIGSQSSIPEIDAMKQAILDYGPICVAIISNSAMQAYRGGIFNSCASGDVNHGVVLVGWDDNQGTDGVWIMRNSWGTWWGEEGGYMRIEYGCSKVGYGACYVNYPGAIDITTQSLPICSLGVAYEIQLEATGGAGDLTWSDRDGSLVSTGLALSPEGLLAGTPIVEDFISFIAVAEDIYDRHDEQSYSIEVCKYIEGDANADADINVGDAVFMINYVFTGGPDPLPVPMAGDANCDARPDIADAVYIINYVFKSGPAPSCP